MNATIKPSRIGFNYGILFGLLMVIVFILQQFIPVITPSRLSIVNLIILVLGLVIAPLSFKKRNDGYMSYGQGLGSNAILILISTVISALFMYLYVKFVDDFYLLSLKEARINALSETMPADRAAQAVESAGVFFTPEFMMVPLLISKFAIGLVLTFIIVAFLAKRQPEFNVNR